LGLPPHLYFLPLSHQGRRSDQIPAKRGGHAISNPPMVL
jgi:hypothetical protein